MSAVVVGDLASVDADALVRPATTALTPASAAASGLDRTAGPTFLEQFASSTEQAVGSAIVTAGGALSAEFVVHAIIQGAGEAASADGVRLAFLSSLHQVKEWQFDRVGCPPLATGGDLVMEATARIMTDVLIRHLEESSYPSDLSIVVETEDDRTVFEAYLGGLQG